ncbi:MAG: aromatic ring-hydroxylating dioxygenase subunit alpha [Steroidobacteraceae bacterium]
MRGLPASCYLDATRAPLEYSAIFAPSWQFVCHVSDLPASGTAVRFDCGGRSAVVLRTKAGGLQGFRNACRHRGARLVDGDAHTGLAFCIDGRLRCPYHGWTYDESGALVSIPAGQHYDEFDADAHSLHPLHVAQWRGLVFVAFQAPRLALEQMLDAVAGAWPDLASLRRVIEPRATPCAADWKLACEHMLDTAHFDIARPALKPRLFAPVMFERGAGDALRATAEVAKVGPGDTWSSRVYRQLLCDRQSIPARAEHVFLWPNLLLQLAPDGLSILQVLPGATGQSTFRELRYAGPDSSREMRLLRYTHQRVRRQALAADTRMLARVQQGMVALGADETGPIASGEVGLRWFVERCRARLPAAVPASGTLAVRSRSRRRAVPSAGT